MIQFVEKFPTVNVDIAHIRGALPTSARYDPGMTDSERSAFANLLLLCRSHHDLIDRKNPEGYPPELLIGWKSDREGDASVALEELHDLTEASIIDLIESAVASLAPKREIEVEVSGGGFVAGGAALGSIEKWQQVLERNPRCFGDELVVATTIRNTGGMVSYVEGTGVEFFMRKDQDPAEFPLQLLGRNDYPYINPQLPKRLEPGEATTWFTALETCRYILNTSEQSGFRAWEFQAWARLGSGEMVLSDRIKTAHLPPS